MRVVVTGIGMVTCLGIGTKNVWNKIIMGKSGIQKLTSPMFEKIPCQIAGSVPLEELKMEGIKVNLKAASQASKFALVAANEAVNEAKLNYQDHQIQKNTGVCVGVSMLNLEDVINQSERFKKGYSKVSPHFIPMIITNMAAGLISMQFKLKGPNHSVATACTTGLHSIGDASRLIRNGDAKIMICGGSDACISPLSFAGFSRMRALSTQFNSDPQAASRPFDALRDGFVMSEGACLLVLESLESALERKVKIKGEILGYGLSSDAEHVTAPSPNGYGAENCMRAALKDSKLMSSDIGYINAHATSTPLGDEAETKAIHRIFYSNVENKEENNLPWVSSTKGSLGHMLAAAGSTEVALSLLACQLNQLPPCINLTDSSTLSHQLRFVRETGGKIWSEKTEDQNKKRVAISNSFGFGGTNASLCVAQYFP